MLMFNEGKVCEAIIRHLEARENCKRHDMQSPESDNHANPVELTWRLGAQLFALEHTGIEPFEDYMRLEAEAKRHFDPIKVALKDSLPPDVIELHVPAKAMLDRAKPEVARIQAALIDWIRHTAPTLAARSYADYIGDISWVSIPNVPFPVRLLRFETLPPLGARFQIVHSVSGDPDQERSDRLRRACDKKFPKLAAWKRDCGARTILVLEDNDIQLTNHAVVAESYLPLAFSRPDRPDETYLVATCMEPWTAWPLLIDDQTMYDLAVDDYVPRWEVDAAALAPATAR